MLCLSTERVELAEVSPPSFWVQPEKVKIRRRKKRDEIKSGKVTLKNLKSGQEISIEIESLVNEIKKII